MIWHAIGTKRVWLLEDGSRATESQADAIAMGYIKGSSKNEEKSLWSIGPCGERQADRSFRQWAMDTSSEYHSMEFDSVVLKSNYHAL